MEKRRSFYFFIFSLSILIIGVVSACTCAPLPPPQEALENAVMVFSGKVVKIIPPNYRSTSPVSRIIAIFEISHIWKGSIATNETSILTPSLGVACGISFSEGGEYLVYADYQKNELFPEEDRNLLWTNFCTRTENISWAQEDLEVFGEGTILKEQVKCIFANSTSSEKCYADGLGFGCSGVGTCVTKVFEEKAKLLTWKSSCGEEYAYSIIDGVDSTIEFECSPEKNITETIPEKNITNTFIVTDENGKIVESESVPGKNTNETLIKRIFNWFKEFFRVG